MGYSIQPVKTVAEIATAIQTAGVNFLIVDFELLSQLPAIPPSIPLIALADFDEPDFLKEAAKRGCVQLMARYYSHEEVAFVLRSVVAEQTEKRRKHPRVLASFSGAVAIGDKHIPGTIINISRGGAFLKCFSELKEGEEVWIEIQLPTADGHVKLMTRSRVVYVKPYMGVHRALMTPGMGVEFLDINDEKVAQLLNDYISGRLLVS